MSAFPKWQHCISLHVWDPDPICKVSSSVTWQAKTSVERKLLAASGCQQLHLLLFSPFWTFWIFWFNLSYLFPWLFLDDDSLSAMTVLVGPKWYHPTSPGAHWGTVAQLLLARLWEAKSRHTTEGASTTIHWSSQGLNELYQHPWFNAKQGLLMIPVLSEWCSSPSVYQARWCSTLTITTDQENATYHIPVRLL